MNTYVVELRRKAIEAKNVAEAINAVAVGEGRGLTADEQRQFDAAIGQAEQFNKDAGDAEARTQRLNAVVAPAAPAVNLKTKRGIEENDAWEYWLRTGDDGGIREYRASNNTDMNVGTPADGGYTVPTGHYAQIIARRDEDMLATKLGVTRIVGTGTTTNVPVDDENDGEFVATTEANDFDTDAPALNQVALTKLLYSKQLQLSYQLLQDTGSNLLEFISDFVGRGLAKTHNSLFITEALANGTAALTLDSATAIGATEIPELVYKQMAEYADGSAWVMARATEGYIRGLASSSIFLFNPMPAGSDRGVPEIWGYPVYNTAKMTGIQASAKSLLFGNFAYMGLYEDPTITFMRDPYTLAGKGQVRLLYYFRADYGVLQAEAIKYATHPTA